jgi:hypothetical protein
VPLERTPSTCEKRRRGYRVKWRKITMAGGRADGGSHESLYTSGSDSECGAGHTQWVRGMFEDGRHLGAPEIVPGVRTCRLLRLVEE